MDSKQVILLRLALKGLSACPVLTYTLGMILLGTGMVAAVTAATLLLVLPIMLLF